MGAPEPCTTQANRKKHWSAALEHGQTRARLLPGRTGQTLCGDTGMDEERANYELRRWSNRQITVADLPECKHCAKAKAAWS